MKDKFNVQFAYTPTEMLSVTLTNTETGKTLELAPKDYTLNGNVLTLKKSPAEHFSPTEDRYV